MRFHYNTTCDETIAYLRDQAIRAKQPPAVIDAIDALYEAQGYEADLEKRDEELNAAESTIDDLREELSLLVDQIQLACNILQSINDAPTDLRSIARQLDTARKALKRHKA